MRPGLLRHTAQFKTFTESRDASGGVGRAEAVEFTRRFRIARSNAKEFLAAKQTNAEMTHLFVFRSLPQSAANIVKMRLSYDSRTFEILGCVDVQGRNRESQLSVRELL